MYKLAPLSALARQLLGALPDGPELYYLAATQKVGRNVTRPEGLQLPPEWIQFSGSHCRVYCQTLEVRTCCKTGVATPAGTRTLDIVAAVPPLEARHGPTACLLLLCICFQQGEACWFVEDTSTNGTYINDVRIVKGSASALKEGDRLRLSSPPGEVLE